MRWGGDRSWGGKGIGHRSPALGTDFFRRSKKKVAKLRRGWVIKTKILDRDLCNCECK